MSAPLSPIEQHQANQREYEEERFWRSMREIQPPAAPFCSEYEFENDGDVSLKRVIFGFMALLLIAVVAAIGVFCDYQVIHAVLWIFGVQP